MSFQPSAKKIRTPALFRQEAEAMEHYLQLLYAIDADDTYQRIITKCLELEDSYPDCRECYLFHQLIGSTPPKHLTCFDLPEKQLQAVLKQECHRVLSQALKRSRSRSSILKNPRLGEGGKKLLKTLMSQS